LSQKYSAVDKEADKNTDYTNVVWRFSALVKPGCTQTANAAPHLTASAF
jgi:hypothetical protein